MTRDYYELSIFSFKKILDYVLMNLGTFICADIGLVLLLIFGGFSFINVSGF